jgi:dienelactone hydrolase
MLRKQRSQLSPVLRGLCATLIVLAGALVWLYWAGPYRRVALDRGALAAARPLVLQSGAASQVDSPDSWQARRRLIADALQAEVYGPLPAHVRATAISRRQIPSGEAGGVDGVEQIEIAAGDDVRFNLVLVMPQGGQPAPVIVMQNFCGNRAAFPGRPNAIAPPRNAYPAPCRSRVFDPIHLGVFGRWMLGPPFERISARGYALAMFYGGDVVPDHAPDAPAALANLQAEGAIATWAWTQARVVDVLETDPRIDQDRIVAWGQSRFGKVALLASALDPRVDAVIALQSGRGGDALTAHRSGESVAAITRTYPYWFSPRFQRYASLDPPVDQHELLALVAPRPLLIGHAERDSWSDPAGAYQAVAGARVIFDLTGAPPPRYFLRPGTHSITDEDWRLTLDFLDASLR